MAGVLVGAVSLVDDLRELSEALNSLPFLDERLNRAADRLDQLEAENEALRKSRDHFMQEADDLALKETP